MNAVSHEFDFSPVISIQCQDNYDEWRLSSISKAESCKIPASREGAASPIMVDPPALQRTLC